MSSEICSLMNLSDLSIPKKFLFATKDMTSDLNFFFNDVLSFYLRKNYSVIFVNLAQSYGHYTHLLMKSNVNIRTLRDQKKVAVVDVMSGAGLGSDSKPLDVFNALISDYKSAKCLNSLSEATRATIEVVCENKPEGFVLFIDEISLLSNLGVDLRALQTFVLQCYSLCAGVKSVPGTLLIGSYAHNIDPENVKLVNYLSHLSDVRISVEGLKTGFSKDTHGKVTFELRNKETCSSTCQNLFFKVEDKGTKLLTLGL